MLTSAAAVLFSGGMLALVKSAKLSAPNIGGVAALTLGVGAVFWFSLMLTTPGFPNHAAGPKRSALMAWTLKAALLTPAVLVVAGIIM